MATNPFSNPDFGSDLLKEDRSANPFSDPNFGKEPEQDGAFIRGLKRAKQSATITTKLATGDTAGTAETIRDAEIYNQQNPSSKESDELSKAWEDGDGITGGIAGVGREFAKDWRESKGFVSGLRETGKNVNALREGIVSQLGNSVAPMVGLVAGGAAGAAAGTAVPVVGNIAGGIAGGWAGAAAGNTLVEGGGQLQDALHKANIDPMDTVAVEKFVAENGDKILGQSAIKGGIIGAVDTATAGIAGRLLNVPARAAVNRALVDMGVDVADKIAVKEAMKNSAAEISSRLASDTAYQASRTGAENIARNAGAAALDPAGEFTGEYVGQGAATGDWNTKNAALEALSSVGQSGAMFAGQKGYQALTNPFRNGKTGEAAPQSNTPITDAAQATGAFPQLPAPSITVNADGTAETAEDRNARIAARAAGDIADVTPIPNTPEYQDVRGFAPAARQTQALEAPTITVDGNGQALTAQDRNNRLSDRLSGGVTDVTPIQRTPEVIPPSRAMGLNPANGSLSGAAAMAVDSGASVFGSISQQGALNGQQTQEAQQTGEGQSQGAGATGGAAPKTRAVKTRTGEIVLVNESDFTSGAKSLRTFTADGKPRAARLDAANIAPPPPKVVLQNRDRSTSASIQQMNDIVAQPDFLKAGTSSTMDRGAPMVFGDLPSKLIVGRTQQVADDSGKRIPTNYAVVEADDLLASNNADGTTNNEYAEGVPGKLRAVAGNGRVAGLQEAWNRGTTGGYAADLAQEAESLGIDPQALAGFSRPVLVRVMDEADVTADIGDRSNIQSNLQLSVLERAGNDVRRMDLRDMEFNDKGNPTSDTMRQFMAAMPTQERGDMLNTQGLPTLQLIDRIKAAAFKQAYMSDSLVELATQSVNDDAKRILNALTMAAGDMVQLDGTGEFDIRQAVADAAGLAVNAAKKGEKLSDYLRTVQIDESPEAIAVARFFEQNSGSANQIADGLRAWANLAKSQVEAARANADQGSMFGETPTLSRNQLFERLSDENITDIEREQLIAQQERAKSIEQSADAESAERAGDADSAPDSEGSRGTEPTNAQDAGREQADFALEQQTPEQIRAQEEAQAQAARDKAKEDAQAAEAERKAVERQEVTQRSEQAADNFQLGQSAEDNLSWQGDIFANAKDNSTLETTPKKVEPVPKTVAEKKEAVSRLRKSLNMAGGLNVSTKVRISTAIEKAINGGLSEEAVDNALRSNDAEAALKSLVDANSQTSQKVDASRAVGVSVTVDNGNKTVRMTVDSVSSWNGDKNSRTYFNLETDLRRTPISKAYEVLAGNTKDEEVEIGGRRFAFEFGIDANSGTKRSSIRDAAEELFQKIVDKTTVGGQNYSENIGTENGLLAVATTNKTQGAVQPEALAKPKSLKEGFERVRTKKAAEKPAKNDATRLGSGATGVADNALSGKDAGAPYQYFEEKTGLIRDVPSMSNRDGTLNEDGKRLAYTEWSAMSEDERALIHEAIAARKTRSQQADDSVRKEYLRAEKARLEGERIILSSNGNPYKTEGAAAKFIEEKGIEESHYAGKVDGGWAAVRRTPSEMLERENGKKGIEDYTTIQSRVVAEMGLTQAWGEDAITDAQWEKIINRVDAIQRGQRGLPPVEQATDEAKPAPAQSKNGEGYALPNGSVSDSWRDKDGRYPEHPNFAPNDRQKRLIAEVKKAREKGLFYNEEIKNEVASSLGVSDEIRAINTAGVDGGDFGYDIYHAIKALDAQQKETVASKIRAELSLNVGDQLGTLVFNDFKQTNKVEVVGLVNDDRSVKLKGKRGVATATFEADVPSVKYAIERAHEKGKRKDSYEEFIASRSSRKQTNPREYQADTESDAYKRGFSAGKGGFSAETPSEFKRSSKKETDYADGWIAGSKQWQKVEKAPIEVKIEKPIDERDSLLANELADQKSKVTAAKSKFGENSTEASAEDKKLRSMRSEVFNAEDNLELAKTGDTAAIEKIAASGFVKTAEALGKPSDTNTSSVDSTFEYRTQGAVDAEASLENKGERVQTYVKGDKAEYTGETEVVAGQTFYQVKMLEGVDEGKTKVVASPPDGDKTATVKKTTSPPVTPQIATPPQLKSMIGIAADSIEKLRKQDVERVLSEAPAPFLQSLAAHIRDKRKDLVDEVAEVMQEVNAKTAPTPTETAPKPEAAPAPTAKKTAAKKPEAERVSNGSSLEAEDVIKKSTGKVENFGEELQGKRKPAKPLFADALDDTDIAKLPLSKIWPADAHEAVEDTARAALMFAARQEIPAKPRQALKLRAWVAKVQSLRVLLSEDGLASLPLDQMLAKMRGVGRTMGGFADRLELLTHIERSQWRRIDSIEVYPHGDRYTGDGFVSSPFGRFMVDGKRDVVLGAKSVADMLGAVNVALGQERQAEKLAFEIRHDRKNGEYFINKKGDKLYRRIVSFPSLQQARTHLKNEYADVLAKWNALRDSQSLTDAQTRGDTNAARSGKDWRGGQDATVEMFDKAFGFRGVEFGSWVSQGTNAKERQGFMNQAYDALHDLADIVGVPTRALSLNGTMGLAFGSRGGGKKAAAHYEPSNQVINLTKTKGAGALAHEWFHALDNYFARFRQGGNALTKEDWNQEDYRDANYMTHNPEGVWVNKQNGRSVTPAELPRALKWSGKLDERLSLEENAKQAGWEKRESTPVRKEVETAFAQLIKTLVDSPMAARAKILDSTRQTPYWSRRLEIAARAFENYVTAKMLEQGNTNDFLANIKSFEQFQEDTKTPYPYLTADELTPVRQAFEELFSTIETKAGENDKVVMFSRSNIGQQGAQNGQENGMPRGLSATSTAQSRTLEDKINADLRRLGDAGDGLFRAVSIPQNQLPDALSSALGALRAATGTQVHIFRNLTPQVLDFNGVSFRDGTVHINETSQNPATLTAAHEWLHNLRRTNPDLYRELADEVARQGRLPEYQQRLKRDGETRWKNMDVVEEELTAAAVSDALTDPVFLQRLAERDQSAFRRVAKAFLEFLKTLTAGWKDQGSNAYLQDVEAFRDKLEQVLDKLPVAKQKPGDIQALFLRVWHGTPHRGIEQTGFKLNKIGTGEGAQVYGWGMYFASMQEVAEWYRTALSGSDVDLYLQGKDGKRVSPDEVTSDERVLAALEDVQQSFDSDATVDPDLDSVLDSLHMDIKWNDLSVRTRGELTEEERATVDLEDAGLLATLDEIERVRAAFRYQRDVNEGQLYGLDLPIEESDLLDRDRPLSEQPAKVREAITGILVRHYGGYPESVGNWSGQQIYQWLVSNGRGEKGASLALLKVGIPGLRYLDGNSRADAEGSHNYVIWDEALLTPEKAQIEAMYSRGRSQGASVAKDAQATPLQQFKETEQRIGGKSAYDKAKAAGRTKLNYSQWVQVRTPAFKAWFGDWENDPDNASKVINPKTGEPLVMYHGTRADFNTFDLSAPIANGRGEGEGFYFISDEAIAKKYAKRKGRVIAAFLNMRKPFRGFDGLNADEKQTYLATRSDEEAYKKLGIDGFIVGGQYIVRHPNQIKSATGNTGAFDSKNPDIRFSRGTNEAMTNNDVVGNTQGGRSADDTAPGGTHPFNGFTREQFLGNPKITSDANAKDLVPSTGKSLESEKNVPFAIGSGLTARYSELSAAVYNEKGDVVASYSYGDTLVVNKKYRRQGIGSELVYQWRMRNPNSKTAANRTKKSQLLQEKVWNRIRSERALYESRIHQDSNEPTAQNTADSRASTAAQNPSNPSQVWAAIEGVFEGIDGLRQRLDAGTTVVRNADELPQQFQQSAKDAQAQGFYDDESKRIYLVADRIEAGQEKAVWLHEVFHKRGSELLGDTVMARLHGAVQRWGARKAGSVERQIYDAAHARAQADGNYNGEFLAYAIEEAVNRGVQPDLKANITSAGYWLGRVREAFANAMAKLTGAGVRTGTFRAEDLVAAAYGAAGLEVAGKGVAKSLSARAYGGQDAYDKAKADGKTKLNYGQWVQVRTPAFKAWFGDWEGDPANASKVVDSETGEPLVVYHGTTADVESFDLSFSGSDGVGYSSPAIFATSDSALASDYALNKFDRVIADAVRALQKHKNENPSDYVSEAYEALYSNVKKSFAEVSEQGRRETGGGANVMPLYMSMQNPLVVDGEGKRFMQVMPDAIAKAVAGGHDGIIVNRVIDNASPASDYPAQIFIAFRPEQIKSATGNSGAFDSKNPDIRFSRASPTTGAGVWQAPEATKFDQYTYLLQDKQIDSKRVVNAIKENGKQIADDLDVYLQETLFHGRAAKRVKDFAEQEELPLIELLRDKGLELSELEEYLHARHAPEANWEMSERNPNKAMIEERLKKAVENIAAVEVSLRRAPTDKNIRKEMLDAEAELSKWRNAKPYKGEESDRLALSGMSNEEAAAVMDSLDATKRKNLQAAAKMVDRIIAKTRETIVDYGLESDDTVDAWSRSWNHYVPLMREQLDDVVMGGMGTGQGFSIKGKETKGRTGSTKKVVDILANINMQRERAIVRGEKNRVATALLGLVKDNPNKDFWRIAESGEIPSTQTIDKKTGLVITQIDPLFKSRDNALVVKVNGVEKVILFNEDNPRAMRMAVALKNMDAANLEGLLGNVASVTRYLAAVNTQYNPIFGIVNMVRDFQEAAINMQATPLAGKQKQVIGNAPKAIWQIGMEIRAQRNGKQTGSEYGSLWEEFQEQGGQTGYRDMFNNSAERSKQLQSLLKPDAWADTKAGRFFTVNGALKVPLEILRKTALRPMLDLLSDYNEAIENGVRLSAYKAALDIGMSKPRAAELAKNLTVNFNRKGQVAQQVGALYAFFNASVQGAARMGQTIFDMEPGKPKTIRLSSLGKKIVGGGVLLGSVQALLLAASGFGDDEPPEFIRKRNLVIPNPLSEKGYISIPMPLGYHVLTNLGRIPTEYALSGFKGGSKRAISLLDVMSDIYNPIGGSGLSMQTLAPSVLDPFAALAENKDFTGRAIAKQSFNKVTPGHALGRDTSSMLAQGMAQVINYATGGTEYTRGELSPTPDQIDYLIGQVTGGVGREASKVSQSTQAIATGDELPWHKVPLVGRFYGDADSPSAKQSAYYNLMDDVRRHSAEVKGLRNDGKATEAIEYMAENPQATLHIAANAAERQVKKLRDRMDDLKEQNAPRESIKEVETQMTEVMQRFAALVQSKKKP